MIGHLSLEFELEMFATVLGMLSDKIYDIIRQKYLLEDVLQRWVAYHRQNLILLCNQHILFGNSYQLLTHHIG